MPVLMDLLVNTSSYTSCFTRKPSWLCKGKPWQYGGVCVCGGRSPHKGEDLHVLEWRTRASGASAAAGASEWQTVRCAREEIG